MLITGSVVDEFLVLLVVALHVLAFGIDSAEFVVEADLRWLLVPRQHVRAGVHARDQEIRSSRQLLDSPNATAIDLDCFLLLAVSHLELALAHGIRFEYHRQLIDSERLVIGAGQKDEIAAIDTIGCC